MSPESVDIELALRQTGNDTYSVDATLQLPGGNADVSLTRNVPVPLDIADLRARTLDPASYGTALAQMLFSPPQLRDAWIKATTYVAATEVPLRVRLRIDPDAGALHALRWETLCDGALRCGEPTLYLEDADGECARVAGGALVRAVADLPAGRRPLLIVLAVCRSAGNGAEDVLAALGPRLAQAGVAAVVGMQGDVPMTTVERLMPRFFAALAEDGVIDRALALARAGLAEGDPWWMPALYLRSRDGRLWQFAPDPSDSQAASSSLNALSGLVAQRVELRGARAQIERQPETLAEVWQDLKLLATRLTTRDTPWRAGLAASAAAVEQMLATGGEASALRRSFVRFAGQASRSFNQTDHDLLTLCTDLQALGLPLRDIVGRLG